MERRRATTTCRCGYSSPSTLPRCLGCGRRFARCERIVVASATPPPAPRARPAVTREVARPPRQEPSPFSGRDAQRFGAPPVAPSPALPAVPLGPVAVLGLVAVAWLEPDVPRVEVLTAAALLGAGLAAVRPAGGTPSIAAPAVALPRRLSDDELRAAIAAW